MAEQIREKNIQSWVMRISKSGLNIGEYFSRYDVPFSQAQYYRYKKKLEKEGIDALKDKRVEGNNRRVGREIESFLKGYMSGHPGAMLTEIKDVLKEQFQIEITESGISRCLKRIGYIREGKGRSEKVEHYYTVCGGFEIITAIALHIGWPQFVCSIIRKCIKQIRRSEYWREVDIKKECFGRNKQGQFTSRYNRRRDVREKKFDSISNKREYKNFRSMSICSVSSKVIEQKALAMLALPVLTNNGMMRSVNTPMGNALYNFCGYNYKQATLNKFLAELKYLGLSEYLLRAQVKFWQTFWHSHAPGRSKLPILCYYIDGNTKALWSKKHVKQNKVSMLGRVMGCIEMVFVHDSCGRPIYFESYAGHAPLGEYTLSLFSKIEKSLEGPGNLPVNRAIVLDGASNGVKTLRAFARQKKYHYITSLDENQWNYRKIRKTGRPQRYRYGKAMLTDCEIELEDSQEKGYLIICRAIKIDWDYGKRTVIITSLESGIVDASEVVKSYFDRWPEQELQFRGMKSVACLNRIAGYGKQEEKEVVIIRRQKELQRKITDLKDRLSGVFKDIERQEKAISLLVKKEYCLRSSSRIRNGIRILSKNKREHLLEIGRKIGQYERRIKNIIKPYKSLFNKIQKAQREWLKLQGKETVYKIDVELDDIMTFFRISLVNLYSYLANKLFEGLPISMNRLVQTILLLPAFIEESKGKKRITLQYNEKDPVTMKYLDKFIKEINDLGLKTIDGKLIEFDVGRIDYHL